MEKGNAYVKEITVFLLLIAVQLTFFGCAAVSPDVPVENRIFFAGKEVDQGTFSWRRMTVTYRYNLKDNQLLLSGNFSFSKRFDSVEVYALIIDSSGNVLKQEVLFSSGYLVPRQFGSVHPFLEKIALPKDAAGFSFSYIISPHGRAI